MRTFVYYLGGSSDRCHPIVSVHFCKILLFVLEKFQLRSNSRLSSEVEVKYCVMIAPQDTFTSPYCPITLSHNCEQRHRVWHFLCIALALIFRVLGYRTTNQFPCWDWLGRGTPRRRTKWLRLTNFPENWVSGCCWSFQAGISEQIWTNFG